MRPEDFTGIDIAQRARRLPVSSKRIVLSSVLQATCLISSVWMLFALFIAPQSRASTAAWSVGLGAALVGFFIGDRFGKWLVVFGSALFLGLVLSVLAGMA